MPAHACTWTRTHLVKYTHAHVVMYTPAHVYTWSRTQLNRYTPAHTYTPAHVHTCTRTHLHTYTPAHVHTCTRTQLHTLLTTQTCAPIVAPLHRYGTKSTREEGQTCATVAMLCSSGNITLCKVLLLCCLHSAKCYCSAVYTLQLWQRNTLQGVAALHSKDIWPAGKCTKEIHGNKRHRSDCVTGSDTELTVSLTAT